jgi:hypothetical protein
MKEVVRMIRNHFEGVVSGGVNARRNGGESRHVL